MKTTVFGRLLFALSLLHPLDASEGPGETTSGPELRAVERLVGNLEGLGFFSPQTMPTSPRPVRRLVPEWHPAEAVMVSIHSLPTVLGPAPSYAQHANLVARLLPMVDVIVLYPEREQTLVGELISRLEGEPMIQRHVDRLSFQPMASPSLWIRDTGPQFGWDAEGRLVAFDFIARPFMDPAEAWMTTPAELAGVEWEQEVEALETHRRRERLADAIPVGLLRHLRLRTGRELPVSRPPISLQGGDFVTDGRGNVFISHETIEANGGDEATVRAAFHAYVGGFNLHPLFTLPGNTPKHLDMVMKFVDAETVILAAPPPVPAAPLSPYLRRLRFEIEAVLQANRRYLEIHFPDLRIIEVPLFPLVDEPPSRILNRLRWRIVARVCELNGLDVLDLLTSGRGDAARGSEVEKAVFAAIARDLGKPNSLASLEEFQAAALHYLHLDLNTVMETNVPFMTIYRSPVNAVHVVDRSGRERFLLPGFAPREGEDPEEIRRLHAQVEAAYREARPTAGITWVEADVAADLQGGLHCMTLNLPAALEEPRG